MFEKYTERARRAIFFARYEASQCNSPSIAVSHLVLGLLREGSEVLSRLIPLHRYAVHDAIAALCVRSSERVEYGTADLPLDAACKRVLKYAAEESTELVPPWIAPEHLLLGVLRETGKEASVLAGLGITLEAVRAAIPPPLGPSTTPASQPVTRESAQELLAAIPDDRLAAAVRILAGLSSGFFVVAGTSTSGRFHFAFGKDPRI